MANPHPKTDHLRPPWKKGESGNPLNKNQHGRPKNRAIELNKKLLGRKKAKAFYGLTNEELDTLEAMLETYTMAELQLLAKADDTPAYAKGYAIAILADMKAGKTTALDRLRESRHGKPNQRLELVGADGQPLIQERTLTAEEAAELMRAYDREYKGGTLADTEPITNAEEKQNDDGDE